jgi:hypothetical protein
MISIYTYWISSSGKYSAGEGLWSLRSAYFFHNFVVMLRTRIVKEGRHLVIEDLCDLNKEIGDSI